MSDAQAEQHRPVDALGTFVERVFPAVKAGAAHPPWLYPYNPYACGATFSLEFFPEGRSHDEYCSFVAETVAGIYEELFGPDDETYIYLAKPSFSAWALDDPDEALPMKGPDTVDVSRFTVPIRESHVDIEAELPLLERTFGAGMLASGEWFGPARIEDDDGEQWFLVEGVWRVDPRRFDHRTMFLAQAHKDFPSEGRPRSGCWLTIANATRPCLLDMNDDRYVGVGAPRADELRSLYERHAALLNDYRREDMTRFFGHWPKPA